MSFKDFEFLKLYHYHFSEPENLNDLRSLDLYRAFKDNLVENHGKSKLETIEFIFNNLDLRSLRIPNSKLTYLPEGISKLSNLKSLDLYNNLLVTLPDDFTQLTNLTWLHLSSNHLYSLPADFGNLRSLEIVYLSNNELSALPESFGDLKNLQTVYIISGNQDLVLPKCIKNLTSEFLLDKSIIAKNKSNLEAWSVKYNGI